MAELEKLAQAITALEAQRSLLGDEVVDAALGPLREKLADLHNSQLVTAGDVQQRRIVTVLFADMSGFTAMSEHVDAEDMRDIMNSLWERLDSIILEHGGKIDKHMGDGVMALWGAEETREDDPERAIHAALAMQAELKTFQPSVAVQGTLKMRLGLNTGPALLGSIGARGEITAMGDTVNLASRLEQACPADGILISHDTYRHVRGVFDVVPQPPLEVKGKTEPVRSYLVENAKPRAFRMSTRGIEGVETRMVGREAELEQLQKTFYETVNGSLQVVTITGDAGVGKSRLLYEFNAWAELQKQGWWNFKGRASLSMLNAPYALLRDIFAFRFEISDSDTLAVAHRKLEGGFREMMPNDPDAVEKAHVIGHLVGLDFSSSAYLQSLKHDPRQLRQQALFYLTQFFVEVSATFPVLMMIDDLQWADSGSLDALTYLFSNLPASTPLMAVVVTRPILFEHYPRWEQEIQPEKRINLEALSKENSRRLVDEILRKVPDLPGAIRELVVGGAEGNPFYLEEFIKMLIDEKVIQPGEETWQVEPSRLATINVPPTLSEVLQARLDSLAPGERTVLQRASVVGRVFWDTAIARLSAEDLSPEQVTTALEALRKKELIYERRPATFVGTREFTFKHTLLHDVTYDTLLKRQRSMYHLLAADWLDQTSSEQRGSYLAQIASHYERGSAHARASAIYSQAAERALQLSALNEARDFFQRALSLLDQPDQPLRSVVEMEIGLAQTCIQLGEFTDAQKHAETASSMAGDLQMDDLVAEALCQLGELTSLLGNNQDSRSYLTGALFLARKDEALLRPTLARIVATLGGVEWRLGNLQQAYEYCSEALRLAEELKDNQTLLMALTRLGSVEGALGRPEQEQAHYQRALALALEIGNRERAGVALNNLGALAGEQGRWQDALAYYTRALELSEETGAMQSTALHLINLGLAQTRLGSFAVAQANLEKGLALGRRIGAAPVTLWAMVYFGLLYHERGENARALELIGIARNHPAWDSENERETQLFLSQWQITPGEFDAAVQAGRQADFEAAVNRLLGREGA